MSHQYDVNNNNQRDGVVMGVGPFAGILWGGPPYTSEAYTGMCLEYCTTLACTETMMMMMMFLVVHRVLPLPSKISNIWCKATNFKN